jgi:hypothetical protein
MPVQLSGHCSCQGIKVSFAVPTCKAQLADAGWVLGYLEAAPIKTVTRSIIGILAIYGEIDPKTDVSSTGATPTSAHGIDTCTRW